MAATMNNFSWRGRRLKAATRLDGPEAMEVSFSGGDGRSAISRVCSVESAAPSIPELKCACGHATAVHTSNTPKNPARRWLQCRGQGCRCLLWIWEDLLNEYVEEMVAYCHAGEYDYLRETCDSLHHLVVDQRHHVSQLSALSDAKELQLQANSESLNQSKTECADLKKKLESEKARTRTMLIEPPGSIPSIADVAGELGIFRGASTSWVLVAAVVSLAPAVGGGAVLVAVDFLVDELGFVVDGEWIWGTEMVEPDRVRDALYRRHQGHKRPY
uniref:Zinc finger GRF-type domain-containing protein n=1 Tax=Oryza punctata TaxID=4537 RepID=A0A0E0KAN6_ORYPU